MKELDDVFLQFELIEEYLYDEKTGLPLHGWDASKKQKWADKETGLSQHHWPRSLGWYAMAMVDVLKVVPAEHPKTPWLQGRFKAFIDATLTYQHNSGTWYQVTDLGSREGNYLEASGTAMLTYAMAKGASLCCSFWDGCRCSYIPIWMCKCDRNGKDSTPVGHRSKPY